MVKEFKKAVKKWRCEKCKKIMLKVKYKNSDVKFFGEFTKQGVCFYCEHDKLKYIGDDWKQIKMTDKKEIINLDINLKEIIQKKPIIHIDKGEINATNIIEVKKSK